MLDPVSINALAASVVALLPSLLTKALDGGAEAIGGAVVGGALSKLKERLTHRGSEEALKDLCEEPQSTAARGALEMQLRKALLAEPELATFLGAWCADVHRFAGASQSAVLSGDNSKIVQISGSGNCVN